MRLVGLIGGSLFLLAGCVQGTHVGTMPPGTGGSAGSGGSAGTPPPPPPATAAPDAAAGAPGAGGAGGSGGTGGAGGGAAVDAATTPPPPPRDAAVAPDGVAGAQPRRAGYTIFHSSSTSMWEIHDPAVYTQFKANFDEIIDILERGYFAIEKRLGTGLKLPVRVIIPPGGCCGGFAGGGDVGFNDGDFKTAGGMKWVRGVVIGETVNGVTGAVTSDWPRDWWADTAWYFPGFVSVDVMKEVVPLYATTWETDEKYPTYPVYVLYKALLTEQGWPVYQRLFNLIKTDKIALGRIGVNPSPIKTNYTIAYLSLAASANLGTRFLAAQVAGVDATVVQGIMDSRKKLVDAAAMGKDTTAGWAKFRMGDYQGATTGL